MNEIKEIMSIIGPIIIITMIFTHFHFKKKIKEIGSIKCTRCDYQGKAERIGTIFSSKIACPECKSEAWKKVC